MRQPWLFPQGSRLGVDNTVLQARARQHRVDNFAGPLSIKTVLSGKVSWTVGGRDIVVDQSSFLVIGHGETYSMDISEAQPVETCCVFFAPGFVEKIARDVTSPLDFDAFDRNAPTLPYLSAVHNERRFMESVRSLAPRCTGALAPSAFEEDFLLLALGLLDLYQRVREEAGRLPVVRESTRKELYRRLLAGREFIHSHASGAVSLEAVARAACLSPYHFHRGFTQAFQQTPHSYLTALRLDQALRLIESGSQVLAACLEVGFSSPSAFSRLFRARYGEVPSKFARSGKKTVRFPAKLAP